MNDASGRVYEFDRFVLNPADRLLLRDGRAVALTPKSFDLLVTLVANGGHLVEKDALMTAVWPNQFVEESNLPFTISVLRKALADGDSNGARLIGTVPKRGYRFTAPVRIVRQQPALAVTERISDNRRQWSRALMMLAATLVMAAPLAFLWHTHQRAAEEMTIRSVAVLPFRQFGGTLTDDHIGLAMSEAVTSKLSGARSLTVRATSSIRQHANDSDAVTIGHALDVDAVVEGTLHRAGDRIRVTAQLVGVRGVTRGASLWAESFDVQFADVFTVQDRIAGRVADALRIHLDAEERQLITKRYTSDPEAFDLYARGRYFWNKRNASVSIPKAVELFEGAIARDPNYALAYSGLADCYAFSFELLIPRDMPVARRRQAAAARARQAALNALALDDGLSEDHASLGQILFKYDWDWGGAERSFEKAIQLNPNYATAHQWYARYLSAMGRTEHALREARRALQIDPASVVFNHTLGETLCLARRYRESIDQFSKTLEMDPNFTLSRWTFFLARLQVGELREAISILNDEALTEAAEKAYAAGDVAAVWRSILEHNRRKPRPSPVAEALAYAQLRESDRAFKALERAFNERQADLMFVGTEPSFDSLRADQRMSALLTRMRLPQAVPTW